MRKTTELRAALVLVEAETLRTWIIRAIARLEAIEQMEDPPYKATQRRIEGAHLLLRFCVLAAGMNGDASLASEAMRIADLSPYDWDDSPWETLHEGLWRVVAVCDRPELVETRVEHPERWVRHALARGVPLEWPQGAALLKRLARDVCSSVHEEARTRLGPRRRCERWWGRLTRSPRDLLGRALTAKEDAQVKGWLRAIDARRGKRNVEMQQRLAEVCALPTPVALDALAVLMTGEWESSRSVQEAVAAASSLPEGHAALVEHIRMSVRHGARGDAQRGQLGLALKHAPEGLRVALCAALLKELWAVAESDVEGRRSLASAWLEALGGAWCDGCDRDALWALVQAHGQVLVRAFHSSVLWALLKVGQSERAAFDARMEGWVRAEAPSGLWSFESAVTAWLDGRPAATQRALLADAIRSEIPEKQAWALAAWLRRYDPATDGPPGAAFEALAAIGGVRARFGERRWLQELVLERLGVKLSTPEEDAAREAVWEAYQRSADTLDDDAPAGDGEPDGLLTGAEWAWLCARVERGFEAAQALSDSESDARRRSGETLWRYVECASAVTLREAGLSGDPERLGWVIEAMTRQTWREPSADEMSAAAFALARLVPGAPDLGCVRGLLDHDYASVRHLALTALPTERPDGREILRELTADGVPWLAQAARERLAKLGGMLWWEGHFAQDPLRGMSADEAAAARPAIEGIMAVIDAGLGQRGELAGAFGEHLRALPVALALEVVEHMLRPTTHRAHDRWASLVVARELPGAEEVLVRALRRLAEVEGLGITAHLLGGKFGGMSAGPRAAFAQRMMQVLADADEEAWADAHSVETACAGVLGDVLRDEDETAALDLALSRPRPPGEHPTGVFARLREALAKARSEPVVRRAAEALGAGCPGAWRGLRGVAEKLVEGLPQEARRELVERCVLSDDGDIRRWAVGELVGPLYDPERDGPRAEQVAAFWEQPRWREAIEELPAARVLVLGARRSRLREGALSMKRALTLIEELRRAHGADLSMDPYFDKAATPKTIARLWAGALGEGARDADAVSEDAEAAEGAGGPESNGGGDPAEPPITEAEWSAWRDVRDAALARGERSALWDLVRVIPDGPMHPRDAAMIAAWRPRVQAMGEIERRLALSALVRRPCEAVLGLIDTMLACPEDAEDDAAHGVALAARRLVRAKLGLAPYEGESERAWRGAGVDRDEHP